MLFIYKGIAVNNELIYDITRCKNDISDGGIVIFANSRLVPTSGILKPVYRYGQLKGMHISLSINKTQQLKYSLLLGSDLVGVSYRPLFSSLRPAKSMKIIPSSHVTDVAGTGLVHCAPAHGAEDYNTFRSLGLLSNAASILCHVDETGAFSPEIANVVGEEVAASLVGKDVLVKGSEAMLQLLNKQRRFFKAEKMRHRYPYDWKTKEPVIVTYDTSFASLFSITFNIFSPLTVQHHSGLPIWMASRKMRSAR